MTEIDLFTAVSQVGFPIGVAVFLLWKGYNQDQKYLEALQKLSTLLEEHIKQKDLLVSMLKDTQK